jgi:orotate phosphoribosyltransferase
MERMQLPSGRMYGPRHLAHVRRFVQYETIRWGAEIRLSSGARSHLYVNGREDITEHTDLLDEIGNDIWMAAKHSFLERTRFSVSRIGFLGIESAGIPLAVSAARYPQPGLNLSRILHKNRKTYGPHHGYVNGTVTEDVRWVTVDNALASGNSVLTAVEHLREDGYPVDEMLHLVLIDREQGGVERLRALGIQVVALYLLSDLMYAFERNQLWPRDRIEAVRAEIKSNHLV